MKTANTMYGILRLPFIGSPARFYHSVGAAMLLLVVFNISWLRKFLSIKPLVTFAKLAFSLYLLHQIVLFSFTSYSFLFFEDKLTYSFCSATTNITLVLAGLKDFFSRENLSVWSFL